MTNSRYLIKDIRISTDSYGCRTAKHWAHGILIDSSPWFKTREDCRRAAAKILRQLKELDNQPFWKSKI